MNLDFLAIMLAGSIKDPILWIVGIIFGWDIERGFGRAICFFVVAGGIWGGIRVAIYLSLGEQLDGSSMSGLVSVCVGLMLAVGLLVRIFRQVYVKYEGK